jgi:hypothetical protein
MDWLKLNSKGILRGSLSQTNNVTQLVWIKLLAMASETRDRDGYLRYAKGRPYSMDYIAMICNVSRNELDIAIDDFIDDVRDGHARVEFDDDGSLYLTNFLAYQKQPEKAEAELSPRLRSAAEKEALTRKMVNLHPEAARDGLSYGFKDNIISKQGEILRQNGETKGIKKDGEQDGKPSEDSN